MIAAFRSLNLRAGVPLIVVSRQLGHSNARGGFSVDPGTTDVFIGTNSDDHALTGTFEVTGKPSKIETFIGLMTELGLVEVSRTGIAAIGRGAAAM